VYPNLSLQQICSVTKYPNEILKLFTLNLVISCFYIYSICHQRTMMYQKFNHQFALLFSLMLGELIPQILVLCSPHDNL